MKMQSVIVVLCADHGMLDSRYGLVADRLAQRGAAHGWAIVCLLGSVLRASPSLPLDDRGTRSRGVGGARCRPWTAGCAAAPIRVARVYSRHELTFLPGRAVAGAYPG